MDDHGQFYVRPRIYVRQVSTALIIVEFVRSPRFYGVCVVPGVIMCLRGVLGLYKVQPAALQSAEKRVICRKLRMLQRNLQNIWMFHGDVIVI